MNNMIVNDTPNKVIILEEVMANLGNEVSTNHSKCDSSPEQSRHNNVKASIQGAEEEYDVIQIVQIETI
jgi:hypothetical protein